MTGGPDTASKKGSLCYLCDQGQEMIDHIIATCPFSKGGMVLCPASASAATTGGLSKVVSLVAQPKVPVQW